MPKPSKSAATPSDARAARSGADATRAALLAAGEKLFAEKSFEGATFEAIAREAGVNKALIAYHFGSKEGLHDAVIEALVGDVLAEINDGLMPGGGDPAADFRDYILALTMAMARRPTMPSILMREYLSGALLARESPIRNVLQFFRTTERLYEAGRKAGRFRALDPHILHLAIVGPVVHFLIAAEMRKRSADIAADLTDPDAGAFAAELANLVLAGVRRAE